MINDVSKMSIVQKTDNIKTENMIPLHLNHYTEHFQVRIETRTSIILLFSS